MMRAKNGSETHGVTKLDSSLTCGERVSEDNLDSANKRLLDAAHWQVPLQKPACSTVLQQFVGGASCFDSFALLGHSLFLG